MSNGNSSGEKRGDAGGKGGGNRRRYFRRRKPATAKTQEATPKPAPRKPAEPPPKGRTRNNAKNEGAGKNERDRDRRGGRRRRRSRSERPEETPVVRESTLAAIDQEYKPPKSVFVYTYVLRPGAPASHEFRAEHFSRVGRRLEDFEIDLSPLFPPAGNAKPEPSPRVTLDMDEEEIGEFSDDIDEADDQQEGVTP
ncbi:MAG: hypothetical protein DYG89_54155 [Caldilinea sp. CFX5]|nr:hypothetical protein [Caldilinea sp. CFX5]